MTELGDIIKSLFMEHWYDSVSGEVQSYLRELIEHEVEDADKHSFAEGYMHGSRKASEGNSSDMRADYVVIRDELWKLWRELPSIDPTVDHQDSMYILLNVKIANFGLKYLGVERP